mmetsp:Transcript_16128/g.37111  ORF Transcript_16128/g.37111 Transcript_16128/m.37111 type:complete len:113 (+) Transcript_16128:151-489(+)
MKIGICLPAFLRPSKPKMVTGKIDRGETESVFKDLQQFCAKIRTLCNQHAAQNDLDKVGPKLAATIKVCRVNKNELVFVHAHHEKKAHASDQGSQCWIKFSKAEVSATKSSR